MKREGMEIRVVRSARRKRFSLTVDSEGLRLNAPAAATEPEIRHFLLLCDS